MRGLEGKVVVVAGGATGIGRGTAIRLGEEGALVVVGDRNGVGATGVAAEIVDAGGAAIAVTFDIATEDGVDTLISSAVDAFGGLHAVHVNAAETSAEVIGRDTDLRDVPLEVFDRTIEVNLRGHVLVTRRALPELLARGGGALVYTSSVAAFGTRASLQVLPSYAMSKSGMLALVRHVASRWGREGIRANALAPGAVQTEKILASSTPSQEEARLAQTPSKRLGRPGDIGAMVAFLCSDDGEWINGQSIAIDGGATMR